MKLFGKKKRYSALRFSTKAVELPLGFRTGGITVAVSQIAERRCFSQTQARPRENGEIRGLVHTENHHPDMPLLPVEIEFDFRTTTREGPIASGGITRWPSDEEEYYILQMGVSDPGGVMFDALGEAMKRAAVSQKRFFHVNFRKAYRSSAEGESPKSAWERVKEQRALYEAVDEGKAELPYLEFDEIVFDDEVSLRAPSWSWDWNLDETAPAAIRDRKVARYRQWRNLPPLPDME
jgi:hypothetical protein